MDASLRFLRLLCLLALARQSLCGADDGDGPAHVAGTVHWVVMHREPECTRMTQLGDVIHLHLQAWEVPDANPLVNDQYDSQEDGQPYFYETYAADGETVTIQEPSTLPIPGIENVLLGLCKYEQRKFVIPASVMAGAVAPDGHPVPEGTSLVGTLRLVAFGPKVVHGPKPNAWVPKPRPGASAQSQSQTTPHNDPEVAAARKRSIDEMGRETVHEFTERRKREIREEELRRKRQAGSEDDDDDAGEDEDDQQDIIVEKEDEDDE